MAATVLRCESEDCTSNDNGKCIQGSIVITDCYECEMYEERED